jgi:hypothetical protein
MNQVKELGHAAEKRDAALAQRTQQLRGIHGFQIDDPGADSKRHQQVSNLRQRVEERQHGKDSVIGAHVDGAEDGVGLCEKILVRQGHALGIAGGP